jgi:transcriptional regulator with XRE-family HTH domain
MEKSIFSKSDAIFRKRLKAARKDAKLSEAEVGRRLGESQTFVSKCERGERRVDVIELRAFCKALEISFVDFIRDLDAELNQPPSGRSAN